MRSLSSRLAPAVLCGALVCLAVTPALGDSLVVNPNLSTLTFGIEVGLYLEEGNPASFQALATAVGQGGVPVGPGKLPGPVVPGFSDGLSAQVVGKLDVTPAGFSINSANLSLLDSGLWQPGSNIDPDPGEYAFDHIAISADLGGFLEGWLAATPPDPPDVYATALLDAIGLSLSTATVPLGGGGSFSDPSGAITLNSGLIAAESNLGSFGASIEDPVGQVMEISGTYAGGVLNIPVDTSLDIPIPTDYFLLIGRISVSGSVVTAKPGDANFDDLVDGGDYTIWADNYLQTDQTWEDGDFTGDGMVDGADYTVWADNYAPFPSASAVPEPSTLVLLGAGALLVTARLIQRRWRAGR